MRKIYQKYFEVPEEGKGIVGERVFFARLTVAIACIVLCMSAMGFSAYAFFTANVSSNMNQIQAAYFDLEIQKIELQTETSSASYESEKTYKLQPGIYDFTLKKNGNATTGYCEILIYDDAGNSQSVYTQQFGKIKDQEDSIEERTIQIRVVTETRVSFVSCWGTYSGNPIRELEEMIIVDGQEVGVGGKSEMLTANEVAVSEESVPIQDSTTSTETTTQEDSVVSSGTPESTAAQTQDEKEEAASGETEGDTAKSDESTDNIITSTNTIE